MAHVERTLTTSTDIHTVWDYLTDFRTSEEWDPPTVSTERTSGDGGVGTTYHNVSSFLGSQSEVDYVVPTPPSPEVRSVLTVGGSHSSLVRKSVR